MGIRARGGSGGRDLAGGERGRSDPGEALGRFNQGNVESPPGPQQGGPGGHQSPFRAPAPLSDALRSRAPRRALLHPAATVPKALWGRPAPNFRCTEDQLKPREVDWLVDMTRARRRAEGPFWASWSSPLRRRSEWGRGHARAMSSKSVQDVCLDESKCVSASETGAGEPEVAALR